MNQRISFLLALSFFIFLTGCKKCKNEDPIARLINNGTNVANAQIKDSGGNIVSINDLAKGGISAEKTYASGKVEVEVSIDGQELTEDVDMNECNSYDITISAENKIVVFSRELN